ncbi:ATP-binding cassette, subfamily B [Streptomyces sp. 2224.1]|uniref:ABC transporter ATP-binding protein n=1 Tax=unclassified Streptomyces TaxID=2593676 RepID=UPI000897720D|nr:MULTISPECIES: ABC transporter ATP-binding protein [unclassified Streptomyces]SED36067.1 ATP-binding cassette, subfamily B [Streptomyces sp. 2112.3]SED77502.1 ATP-binding cassette, subfamily B [Streptomyces sp. 2224.1]
MTTTRPGVRRLAAAFTLARHAAPGALALYVTLNVAAGLLPVAAAWLTKRTLDGLVQGSSYGSLITSGLGLGAAGVIAGLLPHLTSFVRAELERAVGLLAQDRLFGAVNELAGLRRFEDPDFLDRLRLAQQAGRVSPNQAVDGVLGVLRAVVTVNGFLVTLIVISPVMGVLVLLAGVPALLAEIGISRRRARMFWDIGPAERRETFYSELLGTVRSAKEVRLFGTGDFLRGRMLTERRAANAARRAVDRREVRVQSGLGLLAAAVSGAGLLWSVTAARSGTLSIGDITVFVASVAGVQSALTSMAGDVARSHQALLMLDHYAAVTTAGPDLPVLVRTVATAPLRQGIEFRDVWFRYADHQPWVLRGLDLRIPHGTSLALVGLNGAGKSTLIKLICRFYDPTRGAVLWDGVDLREMDPARLRERIGAVFQDFMRYDLTAAENIALGDPAAMHDRGRIRVAADRAGVHGQVSRLPRGYDTLLSRTFADGTADGDTEAGVELSGGQWQRLALARAFLRDQRDLMILDEPSAGLDAVAEHEIHEALKTHRAGRTSVLVSHRLGAVRQADRIVVLADGRITEQGDHAELMAWGGEYARLFSLQAHGYGDDGDHEPGPELLTGGR